MSMPAQDYAEQNAGAIIRFATVELDENGLFRRVEPEARVIGWVEKPVWDTETIMVEPKDPERFGVLRDWGEMVPENGYHFLRNADRINCVSQMQITAILKCGKDTRALSFPHRCPACSLPAQLLFNTVDCSNWRCRHH
jgi:hypothetical protein